ncbi:MAG: NADH:ubiquinone reductase (Na(+)-transporting) subunit C [Parachlamydiales bacterium]
MLKPLIAIYRAADIDSGQPPDPPQNDRSQPGLRRRPTHTVLIFVTLLCLSCALILALLSTTLRPAQVEARQADRARQILIAAQFVGPGQKLSRDQIHTLSETNIRPMLTNAQGDLLTFKEAGVDEQDYLNQNQEGGYADLPYKLLYVITDNRGYVIPVQGFGLWGPLYGYIALEPDATTVKGISWYAPQETPGLGANIQDPPFLSEFPDKKIFQPMSDGKIDLATAPIGITVVKGKVADVIGRGPRSEAAVDGVSGATFTGDGVTHALKSSLSPYRPFLIKANKEATSGTV